jgi:large conductance mechanosensitive channel
MSMLSEFKTFAMRGNVIDLAVGVVIGGAFGKIVTSLVDQLGVDLAVRTGDYQAVRLVVDVAALGDRLELT